MVVIGISYEVLKLLISPFAFAAAHCTSGGRHLPPQQSPLRGGSAPSQSAVTFPWRLGTRPLGLWTSWCSLPFAYRRSPTSAQSAARPSARSGASMSTRGRTQERSLFSVTWVGFFVLPWYSVVSAGMSCCTCVWFVCLSVPCAAPSLGCTLFAFIFYSLWFPSSK